jgi:hypothetical protein
VSNFTSRARHATVALAKMRPHDLLRFFIINGLAVGLGAAVASSCVTVNYPTIAFRCNPKQSQNCPDTHFCCSDDPAAEGGRLPAYRGASGSNFGTPLFSGHNNALSSSGMCVNLDHVPCDISLADPDGVGGCLFPNCPIPCNPEWSAGNVEAVCGRGLSCCQTVEIDASDCVLDGDTWRPARGTDVPALTEWSPAQHETHQDPAGRSCALITGSNNLSNAAFRACVDQLTVANQRGFCMPSCPAPPIAGPDACDLLNSGGVPPV